MKRLIALAIVTLIFCLVFYRQIAALLPVLAYTLVGLLALTGSVTGLLAAWYGIEKVKLLRAARIAAENEAHVMTLTAGNQLWVRDTDHRAAWHALHLEQRVYSNGDYSPPTAIEAHAWQVLNTHRAAPPATLVLPPATIPLNLLAGLDRVQRCLIVGASDTGKTTLLQWIIYRRLHTSKVIVIDPHAWPGKWQGIVFGTGRNYQEINQTLATLVTIMGKRYDDIGKGIVTEGQHPPLTIVIDEWRAITYNVKTASEAIKALLTESRKAAFSVFVATHSDRAKPLGLEGEYDLKDGFAIVRLSLVNGVRTATLDTGNGEQPATLPGQFAAQVVDAGSQTDLDMVTLPATLTPTEARILDLHRQGASFNEIARQVYGGIGGKQTELIKQVIERYS